MLPFKKLHCVHASNNCYASKSSNGCSVNDNCDFWSDPDFSVANRYLCQSHLPVCSRNSFFFFQCKKNPNQCPTDVEFSLQLCGDPSESSITYVEFISRRRQIRVIRIAIVKRRPVQQKFIFIVI